MEKSFDFKKKRSIGSIVEATFMFYKNEFTRFVPVLLMIMLPIIIVVSISTKSFFTDMSQGVFNITSLMAQFLGLLIYIFTYTITYEYIIAYINGDSLRASSILAQTMRRSPKYFILIFLLGIILVVATIFFILPGIYLAVLTSSLIFITRYENASFGKAFDRSQKLMKNYWWKTFALIFILYIAIWIVSFVFQLPFQIQHFMNMFEMANDPSSVYTASYNVFFIILTQLGQVFTTPILVFGTTINYFNLVERKEKKSVIADIESIGE